MKARPGPIALWALLILFPPLVSFSDSAPFFEDVGAGLILAAIGASAWNIVGGYAGQVSVGHAIFFGAGAYVPLLVFSLWEAPPLLGVPLAMLVAMLFAVAIGLPSFRLTGHYFSMATIAVAELVRLVVSNWELLGAAIGMQGPATSRGWWDLIFRSSVPYYYIFLGVLAFVIALTWVLERSRFGYYLRAIRAGERAARSLGVPVLRTKLIAFMLSAALTSIAGALYSIKFGFVNPESGIGILVSVQMVIIAALGGAGTLYGPLIGALVLIPLQSATNTLFGGGGSGLTFIIYGGIILLLARFEPGGLIELWQKMVLPALARIRGGAADAA